MKTILIRVFLLSCTVCFLIVCFLGFNSLKNVQEDIQDTVEKKVVVITHEISDDSIPYKQLVCDGVNDNIEIQNAIDYADIVYIMPGIYNITGKIVLHSNLDIFSDPLHKPVFVLSELITNKNINDNSIRILNIKFIKDSEKGEILFNNLTNSLIHGCIFSNFGDQPILLEGDINGTIVTECEIEEMSAMIRF